MQKRVYRIEIPSKWTDSVFIFWIGAGLELVPTREQAIEVSDEENLAVMDQIDCVCTAYNDGIK